MSRRKIRKIVAAIITLILTLVLGFSGTFAWKSVRQTAKNELEGQNLNPGGRLHDDFDGENKDVYVENFGGQEIFARVRLDEYMEIGEEAGKGLNKAKPLINGAEFGNVTTWSPHVPQGSVKDCQKGSADATFHDYVEWTMGGSAVYMPTFNMNKDSVKADINGSLHGKGGAPYDDYTEYHEGDTKTDTEVWDDDNNNVEDDHVSRKKDRTHTAKRTEEAQVIKMADWDGSVSDTWVIDTDGWAYYAKPIPPGSATGLLLNGLTVRNFPKENWYYGVNAIAQFATAGDWGEDDGTGFFDVTVSGIQPPTPAALALLNKAAGLYDVHIASESGSLNIKPGETVKLKASVNVKGSTRIDLNQELVWEVKAPRGELTGASIDGGILRLPADDEASELFIRAKVKGTKSYGQLKLKVDGK